ncbi:MAG TPA: hypothetical protein VF660_05305 [Actinomycetota bacterium]|jgi:hypothetical protein
MASVVSLEAWRRSRGAEPRNAGLNAETGPSLTVGDDEGVDRLERAADRLHDLVSGALKGGRPLDPQFETELLALIGEVTVGLVDEAAERAERLTNRLESPRVRQN